MDVDNDCSRYSPIMCNCYGVTANGSRGNKGSVAPMIVELRSLVSCLFK